MGSVERSLQMLPKYVISELIDFDLYPLDKPQSTAYKHAVNDARAQLHHDGCAVIKNLLRPTAIEVISQEISQKRSAENTSAPSSMGILLSQGLLLTSFMSK